MRTVKRRLRFQNNLAAAEFRQGKLDDAITLYRRAIAADPNSALAHRGLGDALLAAGNAPDAADEYQRARALSGENR